MPKKNETAHSQIKLIETDDGSHSLYLPELNETYHSFHGAIQESKYVFIDKGWNHYRSDGPSATLRQGPVRILEIGFGTGLNALLQWLVLSETSMEHPSVHYMTLEPYPLPTSLIKQLNYERALGIPTEETKYLAHLHQVDWEKDVQITEGFTLHKTQQKLEDITFGDEKYDLVYFDAFAPSKQPELWSLDLLRKVVTTMVDGGVFVTYCAKGQLKRDLMTLGMEVETLPGPPGKKEMVRAKKQ